MTPSHQGSFRLFRFAGIDVFLHWSWFLVAIYEVNQRSSHYTSMGWNGLEYLAIFGLVLLHEFGHALACRQVGGQADRIVLWPLGGVAYVQPPQRPGATLWSIAAGPLVNVILVPVLLLAGYGMRAAGLYELYPNVHAWMRSVTYINYMLLVFNLLPIYPLDGGQIFRSLLWFVIGRFRSLMVATIIGFLGVIVLGAIAWLLKSIWIGVLAAFMLLSCRQGWQYAMELRRRDKVPKWAGFACPSCRVAPLQGAVWVCGHCRKSFDTFETQAVCPQCGTEYAETQCFECGHRAPMSAWRIAPPPLSSAG